MRPTMSLLTLVSLAALGLAACSSTPETTGTSGGTETTGGASTSGGTTTGSTTTGGTDTSSGTSSSGGSSSTGGDAGPPGLGNPCNPTAAVDPCVNYFLGCSQDPARQLPDGGSTCQPPAEFASCSFTIGCADTVPPLHCLGGSPFGLAPTGCAYDCNVAADCPTSVTSCQTPPLGGAQRACLFNVCGQGTNNGQIWASCTGSATNDSTCEPLVRLTQGDLGICDQGGSAPLWEPCTFRRDPDGGGSTLCAQNATCVPFISPNGPRPFCSPVCSPPGALGPGPACVSGQTCVQIVSLDFGACLVDCGGGQACPSGFVCKTVQVTPTQTSKECLSN